MSDRPPPAEAFPLGIVLQEELEARGWTCADAAAHIRGTEHERKVWELTIDLLIHCSDEPDIVVRQDTADALAEAFGTSAQFWINLHDSYHAWRKARGVLPEPPAAM